MSVRRRLVLGLPLVASLTLLAGGVSAEPSTKLETVVEVRVLHGTHETHAGDRRVVDMPELQEGPFASYSSYALLSRVELALRRAGKRRMRLPNGRVLEARLDDILPDGSSRLIACINQPGGQDFLPLLEVKARPGQAFIVAGQSYKRGMLVLVIKVLR